MVEKKAKQPRSLMERPLPKEDTEQTQEMETQQTLTWDKARKFVEHVNSMNCMALLWPDNRLKTVASCATLPVLIVSPFQPFRLEGHGICGSAPPGSDSPHYPPPERETEHTGRERENHRKTESRPCCVSEFCWYLVGSECSAKRHRE